MRAFRIFRIAALTAAVFILFSVLPAASAETADGCLNEGYAIEMEKCTGRAEKLSDYFYKSSVRIVPGSTIRLTGPADGKTRAKAIYLQFIKIPESFTVHYIDAAGNCIRSDEYGTENDPVYANCLRLREYAADIPDTAETVEFLSGSDGYISELRLYADLKDVPETAEMWEPPCEKADILFAVAHPDDEHLMMGGIVPIYAAERGKKVQMVYMTANQETRKAEALHGLWVNGLRNVPVFLDLKDKKTMALDAAMAVWEKAGQDALGVLVEQIRRFRPEIVVSHDPEGEYGHGAHRATSYYVGEAVKQAADSACYPESFEKYGEWQVKKLYLHLAGEKDAYTVLPVDEPLQAFDGKSGFEMAQLGYAEHEGTQGDEWMKLLLSREFDCSKYGLVFSTVGQDEQRNDFFEHLGEE